MVHLGIMWAFGRWPGLFWPLAGVQVHCIHPVFYPRPHPPTMHLHDHHHHQASFSSRYHLSRPFRMPSFGPSLPPGVSLAKSDWCRVLPFNRADQLKLPILLTIGCSFALYLGRVYFLCVCVYFALFRVVVAVGIIV